VATALVLVLALTLPLRDLAEVTARLTSVLHTVVRRLDRFIRPCRDCIARRRGTACAC
jgi:hypothetical protein